jgi:hypothetical protein
MKKTIFAIGFAGVMSASLAVIQTAQAQGYTDTLADLAPGGVSSGGTLIIDDKIFSDFNYTDSGLTGFNPASIQLTASAVGNEDFLTLGGDVSLVSAGLLNSTGSADLAFSYVVTATGGNTINEIDQQYTGVVAYGVGTYGIVKIATIPGGGQVGQLTLNNSSAPISPSQPVLDVEDTISLNTVNTAPIPGLPGYYEASVSISQDVQSFEQVPEPTTISLLLLPFGAGTLRIFRKTRAAA